MSSPVVTPTLDRSSQTGTAAELLHYSVYTKKGTSDVGWTRWSSASENFEIAQTGGKKYLVMFDKNFAKKHLVTLSKKGAATTERAAAIKKAKTSNTDEQNLIEAQNELLAEKILKVLLVRGTKQDGPCLNCGHAKANNPDGTGHNASGVCKVKSTTNVACTCAGYKGRTAYEVGRDSKGKPDLNPLAGATTKKSTVLVLNRIPLAEFNDVVAKSIVHVDADEKMAVGTEVHLKWDFGKAREGAILYAEVLSTGAAIVPTPAKLWMEVSAKKVAAPTGIASAWQVFHWSADGA